MDILTALVDKRHDEAVCGSQIRSSPSGEIKISSVHTHHTYDCNWVIRARQGHSMMLRLTELNAGKSG